MSQATEFVLFFTEIVQYVEIHFKTNVSSSLGPATCLKSN